ncbi:CRM-domain containing factor CFM2, chloroplastic [Sesamum angolense]|uniref:CRM-domain containing factor CFM2, chloroplastic n=1 Tax=Sesamum angolense TaxID=2727404 RepID=A0AAE2BPI0_9LAMI|nr:CRM-domain containing factor CFM2, chloroplastic [Sesamum angolense]
MLVSLCNCDRHFSFLPSTTLLKPSFGIPTYHYPNFLFKPLRQRASISVAASGGDSQTLPASAIHRIAEKLRSLGYVEESSNDTADEALPPGPNSPGEIFIPFPTRLPKYRVGHTLDPSWSTPENPIPDPGSGNAIQRFHELRRGVLEEEEKERIRKRREGKKESAPSLAELMLPKDELRRLRSIGIGLTKKLKVGKAGITEGIVNGIHERWRRSELVKITCEDICRLNMKRTHELLERKTGGLVIWRSGSNIILYRGSDYKYPYFLTDELSNDSSSEESPNTDKDQRIVGKWMTVTDAVESPKLNSGTQISHLSIIQGVGLPNRVRSSSWEAELADEVDALLEGLGPRFTDWWGCDPLPVDADLLPAVVSGYKRPFRLLPYGVKPKLTNDEMTITRSAFTVPFCSRNRKLQGLAAAIVKLWEKCEIAKIAIKRGVQNTNSELMAEELKWLTGGTLLSRDKEFIAFYRGKDFLPAAVSSAIEERRKYGIDMSKTRTDNLPILDAKEIKHGTKEYSAEAEHDEENNKKSEERKLKFSQAAMERTSNKLSMALAKKARAEKLLAELEKEEMPQPPEIDKEGITEEERYMLRKVGLRMKPFLLLGRRGVFDGTIENMHLHWKYRELVKVCIGRRSIEEIHEIARTLEAESGGILVAVERVSKGYAIIVYRGKNYTRPASLRPQTLLSKREAMRRSLEAQRRESLKLHVLKLSRNIDELKLQMAKEGDDDDMQTKDLELGFCYALLILLSSRLTRGIVKIITTKIKYFFKILKVPTSLTLKTLPMSAKYLRKFTCNGWKARESHGTDDTSMNPEDSMHTSKGSEDIVQQDSPGYVSLQSAVKGNYMFETTEEELQPRSLPQETKGLLSKNEQSGRIELSSSLGFQDRTSSSTTTCIRSHTGGRDSSIGGFQNAELEPSLKKALSETTAPMPFRALQLSNRERLLLRKQALKMKKLPVLAVGKSNVVTGVAKAIKAHFEKHPLAIVNIKGRAKGTSIREVIYNLEQATGAVLVSQEPSKVILYRGWGSGVEPDQASGKVNKDLKNDSAGGEEKARPHISPELISAIRLENLYRALPSLLYVHNLEVDPDDAHAEAEAEALM